MGSRVPAERPMTEATQKPSNRRRGGGRTVAGELKLPLYCYAVRVAETKAAVCIANVASFYELYRIVDRYTSTQVCEYALTTGVVIHWDEDQTLFPPDFDEDGTPIDINGQPNPSLEAPQIEGAYGDRGPWSEQVKWFPLGSSVIYAVKSGQRIKVGFSTNLKQRLKDLNAQAAEPVELIAKNPGDLLTEAIIQEKLADRFVHGEWMELDDIDLRYLLHMMRNTVDG